MEKENIQVKEKSAVVECPFCHKPIEAPLTPDVIFKCPQCHKELITYDKREPVPQRNINNKTNSSQNSADCKGGGNNQNVRSIGSTSLIYCKDCGKLISNKTLNCPYCSCPVSNNKEISLGYLIISFMIPLIGIILCCASWNNNDGKAKSALIGTLTGAIFTALIYSMF